MAPPTTSRSLEIYIAESCFGCERAREMARKVGEWDLPHVTVSLRDIGDRSTLRPDNVFAVPTYLLDGRVISLGNPEESRLYELLMRSDDEGMT
jgi:hypothetical protein